MANSAEALAPDVGVKTTPAAYVPFRTFQGAIDALEHGIPKRIDRTIWRSQSGVVQSQIMMALRFFNLLDDEDRPTPALHRLVGAGSEKRSEQIAALLHYGYHDIIAHDLTKMTPKMLEEAMEQYHVSGDTKRKAVTFFLQAARFAELPMHPLLQSTIRNTSGVRRRRNKVREIGVNVQEQLPRMRESVGVATGTPPKVINLKSGGKVTLTVDVDLMAISPEDREFVFELIDRFKVYEVGLALDRDDSERKKER